MELSRQTTIRCPGCSQNVDEAWYGQHISSGHITYVVDVTGVGPQLVQPTRTIVFLDIPYFGRIRRDAFIIYTLFILLIGVLLGAGYLG